MPTNDFIGFASAGSANIMSQADYTAAAEQTDGVQPGPASSALANKIWRQGANMAAAIGQLMSDCGYDARDDGDIATLKTNLLKALSISKKYDIVNTSDVSVPTSTDTNISSYTFVVNGIYIAQYTLTFRSSNASGIRQLVVSATSGGGTIDSAAVNVINAAASGYSFVQLTRVEKITTANTVRYLVANQTSGSAMNVRSVITVARIGDI